LRRPTRRVKGRIGADTRLQGARVARIAECRLEQKVGYGRHTDHPQWYATQIYPNTNHDNLGYNEASDPRIFKVLWEIKKMGLREPTIKNNAKPLSVLSQNCDLSRARP
jgi:hypothetical protein